MRWLLPLVVALLLGCGDFVSTVRDQVESAAERPEGWESLEDESASLRLYYQYVDDKQQVRFVETLEDVPEALRAGRRRG